MLPKRFRTYNSKVAALASSKQQAAQESELKAYAAKQEVRLAALKVGAKDVNGNTISKVFSRGDDFVVYEIAEGTESESFKVQVDTKIEADPSGYIDRFEKIKPSIDHFRSVLWKGVHDKSVKHRAATAVATALRGNVETAEELFKRINEQVQQEHRDASNGRLTYLGSSFSLCALLVMFAMAAYIFRDDEFVRNNVLVKHFVYASAFAAVGGFFSICINLRSIEFERALDKWKYAVYGLQRVILAGICGIISYLLIASDVIFSFLLKSANPTLSIMLVCVLSGFSETLIPNALRGLEAKDG